MPLLHAEHLCIELIRHLIKDFVITLLTQPPPLLFLNQVLLHILVSQLGDLGFKRISHLLHLFLIVFNDRFESIALINILIFGLPCKFFINRVFKLIFFEMFCITYLEDASIKGDLADGNAKIVHDSQSKQVRLEFLVEGKTRVGVVVHKQSIKSNVLVLKHKILLAQIAPLVCVCKVSQIMFLCDMSYFMKKNESKCF